MTKKITKILYILLSSALLLAICGCGQNANTTTTTDDGKGNTNTDSSANDASQKDLLKGTHTAVITVKGMGDITVELDADTAPITVTNFVKLANEKFYDGLTFHRIIEGFMIQGGDPNGDGTGGSEQTIKGEFSSNGVKNDIKHERGVISMARSKMPDSASSQFFIMHEEAPHLDGDYAAFGHVTDGMDIVDKIAEETPVIDRNGTTLKKNQPVIESIVIK